MKILVAEDTPKHVEDAKRVAKEMGLEIVTARTVCEARDILITGYDFEQRKSLVDPTIDGVVTDIFMPLRGDDYGEKAGRMDNDDSPCGLVLAAHAQKTGVPFVLCTNGYHHGAKFQWIHSFSDVIGWDHMIDSGSGDGLADTKNWHKAFETVAELINAKNAPIPAEKTEPPQQKEVLSSRKSDKTRTTKKGHK